ncbi:MAG TPA: type I-B CRISPR-associated protein Cas5 [Syntrophomonas sp.]|jgi:CRISPR-associated protein Cas5h|nr:type I-B CRISPR-associated protein Cas5 [Syntrophomonas sp.]
MMKIINFRLEGRFGHFLRADAGVSAISYPVPPRTVILGIIGAVLGLEKDRPQTLLEPMQVAIGGRMPGSHWHKAKFRKDPPEALSYVIKKSQKQEKNTKPERATLITQEWLFNPSYDLFVALPEPFHSEFASRLKERRWYFQPSLGLSEMLAELEFIATTEASKLPEGTYPVETLILQENVQLAMEKCLKEELAINLLRLPRTVTPERVFTHANYFMERDGRPIMVKTSDAYLSGKGILMFL